LDDLAGEIFFRPCPMLKDTSFIAAMEHPATMASHGDPYAA
jgi:hypothetical protein